MLSRPLSFVIACQKITAYNEEIREFESPPLGGWLLSVADKGIDFGPPHFKIALHVLARLARNNSITSSAVIASQVDSHATFLRRVMQALSLAGIVESRGGREGGYLLRKSASFLTLGEIYEAVHPGRRSCYGGETCRESSSKCGEASILLDQELERILQEAEASTIQFLNQFTLEQVMCRIPFFKERVAEAIVPYALPEQRQ